MADTRSSATASDARFIRLLEKCDPDSRLLRTSPLTGGVSARVTVLEIERPDGALKKLIVRQHGEIDRTQNPQIARDEFRLLQIVQSHGLSAPVPYYVDESCDLFETPLIVIEYVDGQTEFAPDDVTAYVSRMAMELASIHRIAATSDLAFLPRQDRGYEARPATLDDAMGEGKIRDALESAWPLPRTNAAVLLHGDYWPGNILWNDGELAAVIDWEDARTGDPLVDLGSTRLEVLWAFGDAPMETFTRAYTAAAAIDLANLPYWDLSAALRPCSKLSGWGLEPDVEQTMRQRHEWFVMQAIGRLTSH